MLKNKICNLCKIDKPIEDFRFKKSKNHWMTYCRKCENIKNKEYKLKNKEKVKEYNKNYMAEYNKVYYQTNKEKLIEYQEIYRENNEEKIKIRQGKHYEKNKDKLIKKQSDYYKNNKEKINLKYKENYSNNREKMIKQSVKSKKERRKKDPIFRLRESISSLIGAKIRKNNNSFTKFLVYTIQDLRIHLESLFEPWMTWENRGVYRIDTWNDEDQSTWFWQIDHIIPHSKFNYTSMEDEEFKKCWALENLRPLSAKQNNLEGNRR